jgi:prolyl oligopeptidase
MPSRLSRLAAFVLPCVVACAPAESPIGSPPPSAPAPPPTVASVTAPAASPPPPTDRRPVVDEYSGTKVTDDYRWLENGKDPAVVRWSEAQNAYARAHLDTIPARTRLRDRLRALIEEPSPRYFDLWNRKTTLFAMKLAPPAQQPMLVVLGEDADPANERVVLDPSALDPSGGTEIDFYAPSLDGKRVAVSLSKGGSEAGSVHVYDATTGKETGDVIPRVNGGTAGGSVAWNAAGTALYYTRYPHEGERAPADLDFYQQVYFHTLGTPVDKDTYAVGKEFPRIAEVTLRTTDDGKLVLARVANGDGGEFAYYVAPSAPPAMTWTKVADFADGVVQARFGPEDALYLLSQKGAPRRRVLRVDPMRPQAPPKEVIPQGNAVISDFSVTKTKLYTIDVVGGPSQMRVFTLDPAGGPAKLPVTLPILAVSTVSQIARLTGDDILFENESFVSPPAWYRYSPKSDGVLPTALRRVTQIDFTDAEVIRETCTSKDGTLVPMTVVRKKGMKLDGSAPALLTGYGGYGVSEEPWFRVENRLWLDLGGVFADANIRGGGEWGEEWHAGGKLVNKQNVFDDLYACAQTLVHDGATRPEKLAIEGGSNGGLLMGAELTQHPDAYRAVVSHVGIYDMLRVELTPNGAFNVTEFGTVKDPAEFKAMLAYSPLHHVVDGTRYPAVLMLTGVNDPRVEPWHSRKMVARLQAATTSGLPVLLRTSGNTGHGIGTPLGERVEQSADVHAFLVEQLGITVPESHTPTSGQP